MAERVGYSRRFALVECSSAHSFDSIARAAAFKYFTHVRGLFPLASLSAPHRDAYGM